MKEKMGRENCEGERNCVGEGVDGREIERLEQ